MCVHDWERGTEGTTATAGRREMEKADLKQEVDGEQRVSYFHGDKVPLMNLNLFP